MAGVAASCGAEGGFQPFRSLSFVKARELHHFDAIEEELVLLVVLRPGRAIVLLSQTAPRA